MIKAYEFDQGATRDVGVLFLPELAKTLTNGSCPGHHNGVVIRKGENNAELGWNTDFTYSDFKECGGGDNGCLIKKILIV